MYGNILIALRKNRGYTQEDIAKYLHISTSSVSNYENSVHYPTFEMLVQLCDLYHVSVDYVLERTKVTLEIELLNKYLDDSYTLGNCLELIATSDKEHCLHMLKYFELTQPRFKLFKDRSVAKKE